MLDDFGYFPEFKLVLEECREMMLEIVLKGSTSKTTGIASKTVLFDNQNSS